MRYIIKYTKIKKIRGADKQARQNTETVGAGKEFTGS